MENALCKICKLGPVKPEDLGPFIRVGKIYCHVNCMYFSTGLPQDPDIDNSRLGFNERNINRLVKRVSGKICLYCGQGGANIMCAKKGCYIKYHFKCGLPHNVTYQFHDTFASYCHLHKVHFKKLNLPSADYRSFSERCVYCFEDITGNTDKFKYFRSLCCNGTYMHIKCVKLGTLNAGAFTKCPGCNSDQSFIGQLLTIGVNVPHADATWEDNNNFADLYNPQRSCKALNCLCPDKLLNASVSSVGRMRNDREGCWKLLLCKLCGGNEMHRGCLLGEKRYKMWHKCRTCSNVEIDIDMRRRRKKCKGRTDWVSIPQSSRVLRNRNY